VYTYSWNGEALLSSAAGVTYTYDGDGKRVAKSNGTLYWYCATCGKVLAESDSSGNLISEYTFFGNQRIARRDVATGNIYYIFSDRLGSYRTLTDSSGNVQGESDYYPFGGERVISSAVTDSFRFAGMEWDSEDGLNHTLFRKYTPALGRWHSGDPKRGCVNHPQGHNRYGYVAGNPTNLVDPNGDLLPMPGCDEWDPTCYTCDPWIDPECGAGEPQPPPTPRGGGGGGGPVVITVPCAITTGPTSVFGNCYYTAACTTTDLFAIALFHFTVSWVKSKCNRPDLNQCPPKAAVQYSLDVQVAPPPPVIVGSTIGVNCAMLPPPAPPVPLPPKPRPN